MLFIQAAAVIAVWSGLVWKLQTDWSTNAQYEFGVFVPFLAAYLIARRWEDRPATEDDIPKWAIIAACGPALFMLLPIRMIAEANPDWRPLNWIWAGDVVLLTLLFAGYLGGWRWIRHFCAPIFLIFFALSWPLAIEQGVIQNLARFVARVTVELLGWMDIGALQHGNVIELEGHHEVGIADACSGVRSVAGTLMASCFFGEYYRLAWIKRGLLMAAGLGVALGLNLVRTTFLCWQAATSGTDALEHWHDPAGYLIFFAAFIALWGMSAFLSARGGAPNQLKKPEPLAMVMRRASPVLMVSVLSWLVLTEAINETWYRMHEPKQTPAAVWRPKWPAVSDSFQFLDVPDQARAILRYSEGTSAQLDWPDGDSWSIYFFQWAPGRTSSELAVMHRPEICMPATGVTFLANGNNVQVKIGGTVLPFQTTVFEGSGGKLYVFRCLWEDRQPGQSGEALDISIRGRLKAVWYGRRNLGQRLLQVCVVGANSEPQAAQQLQQRLPGLVTVTS